MDIPVYLIVGFLDGGKTNFINSTLKDGFALDDRTLLLCCEEGEEEYDTSSLKNVTVLTVPDEAALTTAFLKDCEKKYRPQQVIIEYNGMWQMEPLYRNVLPANWVLYQIMCFVQASTFELYVQNMGQLMMEKITNADLIIFNRCDEAQRTALRKRNLRMVNRRADIYLENIDGSSEEYANGEDSPFDLTRDTVEIPDDDFGIWYVDVMDHPERYEGKQVHLKAIMCHSKQFKGTYCPGRFAMICCEKDISFLGVVCKGDLLEPYKNRDWMELRATIHAEEHAAYQGIGPVLYVEAVAPCDKPKNEVVNF
ncbi:MAG: GTP-binding protein [Oscillospiraceae bacterium]